MLTTLDLETHPIGSGCEQFPKPVGLAVRFPNGESTYLSWGHPSGNNCTEEHAQRVWRDAIRDEVLFHNAKFDLGVVQRHWNISPPPWHKIHDTMFLVFLADNLATTYALKPSAERYLNLPPDEQDELLELAKKLKLVAHNTKSAGAVIAQLPAGPVGRYAIGDVDRTYALFKMFYGEHQVEAYDRERKLVLVLLKRELAGIKCDFDKLSADYTKFNGIRQQLLNNVHSKVGADVNLNSGPELAKALIAKGLFDESKAIRTPTGKISTARDNLDVAIKDQTIISDLAQISQLNTYLDTFMQPWLLEAQANNGRIFPSFNQVRQTDFSGKNKGTKTGRLSAPRFLNTPKTKEESLPHVRSYIQAESGHVWVKRDYSQQEYRVLAHYLGGLFAQIYKQNPKADVHQAVADLCGIARRPAKTVGFGILYGLGVPGLAAMLGLSVEETRTLLYQYMAQMPELPSLKKQLSSRYRQNLPIRTLGGRLIKADPPGYNKKYKRVMTYDYKLLNYLIQGGSADVTKESIILFDEMHLQKYPETQFNITVHDELNNSTPKLLVRQCMLDLYESMLEVEHTMGIDIRMESDGSVGPNWGELTAYEY